MSFDRVYVTQTCPAGNNIINLRFAVFPVEWPYVTAVRRGGQRRSEGEGGGKKKEYGAERRPGGNFLAQSRRRDVFLHLRSTVS